MGDFLFYVLPDGIDARAMRGEVPLVYAASDQFTRRGVRPGDTLWIVRCPEAGHLELAGRIVVDRITDRPTATEILGRPLFERANSVTGGVPNEFVLARAGTHDHVRLTDISEIAELLRFEPGDRSAPSRTHSDRLPRGFTGPHLQTLRILTVESALILENLWGRARRAL